MQIEVIASVNEARSDDMAGKTVLVIDVLRATSNIVTALAHGCLGVVPLETVQQAKNLLQPGALLGGERNCKKPAGFDLGNSPFEYKQAAVSGKRILMTTTNGTRAIQKTQRAHTVIGCSLLNVTACAEAAAALGRDVAVLCAGTQDEFSLEDGLCAGMAVEELIRMTGGRAEISDFGLAMASCYADRRNRLSDALLGSSNGKRLVKMGFRDDVEYCAQTNVYHLAPVLHHGVMVLSGTAMKH